MSWIRQFLFKVWGSVGKEGLDAEMSEEVRMHIELLAERNVRNGMSPEEALYAARRRFGGTDQIEEKCRDERRLHWIENFMRDLRFALRGLCRKPGFTVAMMAILAIGIGATSAIVNIGRAIVFPVIPFPEPDRLVIVTDSNEQASPTPYPFFTFSSRFEALRETSKSFAGLGAVRLESMNLVIGDTPAPAQVNWVTDDFLGVLGAVAERGRLFVPGDFKGSSGDVAVLDWVCWQRRFGGDPGIVGKDIFLGGKSRTVVGVLAKAFRSPPFFAPGEIFLPESFSPKSGLWPFRWLQVVGRLRKGIARDTAQAETGMFRFPELKGQDAKPRLVPLPAYYGIGRDNLFWVFLGAVGFLYAIACSNAASLMLTRTVGRRRELGIRLAMGGSRWQIARLLVAESLVLSLTGGAIGLLLSWWSYSAAGPIFNLQFSFDLAALAITLALSVLTCCVVVLVPTLRLQNARLSEVLNEGAGSLGDSRRLGRLRAGFVVVQAALAVALLCGAGMMARSFLRLQKVNLGFDPTNKVGVSGILPENMPQKDYLQLADRMREVLCTLPGVKDATFSVVVPFSGFAMSMVCKIVGRPELKDVTFSYNKVSPEYFSTLGVPILAGRGFEGMKAGDPPVAVINRAAARKYFGDSSPIGQRLDLDKDGKWEIVGVVGDVKEMSRRMEPSPQLYMPLWQPPVSTGLLFELVRMAAEPGPDFEARVRRAAYEVDPRMAVSLSRLTNNADDSIKTERYTMVVLQVLSALALILAMLGIFAVMAFAVAQRQRELGLRMALGAAPADLMRSVLARGMGLAAVGVAVGLGAAWGLTRFLQSVLFETSPHDPTTLVAVAFLLLAVALLACWLPARRAASIDPIQALRME